MPKRLKASPIQARTKGEVRRLRIAGFVPVSVQHRGRETLHLQEEARPLDEFIRRHGQASLLELEIAPGNERQTVMVHDVQRDPISHHLLQVTFQSIDRNEPMKAHIPLNFTGEPEAARHGTGVVQHAVEAIEVRCLPGQLPEQITVDISEMAIGSALRVSDLPPAEDYEVLTTGDTVLVTLSAVRAFVETLVAEEETAAPVAPAENV